MASRFGAAVVIIGVPRLGNNAQDSLAFGLEHDADVGLVLGQDVGGGFPDLALGLLFVAAVGLGAFAGSLALAIHTATVLGKLLSESVEDIDEGVVEAIRATGAGYPQILTFAVLPGFSH